MIIELFFFFLISTFFSTTLGTFPLRAFDDPPGIETVCPVTRAGELMYITLEIVAREYVSPSEPCVSIEKGRPGIYTPAGTARAYRSVAAGMYNIMSKFHKSAVTTFYYNDSFPRLQGSDERKQQMITYASFYVLEYLIPEGVKRNKTKELLESRYGVNFKLADAKLAKEITGKLIDQLRIDNFNQEGCYADTTGFKPANPPTNLTNYESIDASRKIQKKKYRWSQEVIQGVVNYPIPLLTPQASLGKTFISKSLTPPPPNFRKFDAQYQRVAEVKLDDRKKIIAEFWDYGPGNISEAGTWQLITLKAIGRKCYNLDYSTILLFATANAIYDAIIFTWQSKRKYNTARPDTFIPTYLPILKLPDSFQGNYCPKGMITGEQWRSYLIVASSPEYVSGHASMSRAAAEVLRLLTGSNDLPGGPFQNTVLKGKSIHEPFCPKSNGSCTFVKCRVNPGFNSENIFTPKEDLTRTWDKFTELSDESSRSRIFGGIHISYSILEGIKLAKKVGPEVCKTLKQYIDGTISTHMQENHLA